MERAVYRIIDANFNRAREAVRVIEDFCRFALNSAPLTERARQLRHELASAIEKLDSSRLISSRDTLGDVGTSPAPAAGVGTSNRRQRTEGRRQRTEERRQRTEDRRQRAEERRQRTEDRRQKTEDGRRKMDDGRATSNERKNNQLQRSDLKDCFTAGCKRLTEALRTLAETTQTLNPSIAEQIEKLRYAAYTLEKDIVLFSEPAEKFRRVRLYVIISSSLPADVISLTHRCVAGGADCIQLRAKAVSQIANRESQIANRKSQTNNEQRTMNHEQMADDKLFALAVEFVQICKAGGVLSILNDRADIAVVAGADGVHLGQNDLPVEQARKLAATPLITGKSTHSLEQLRAACQEHPTYVGLGPVFATPTKPDAKAVGLDYVRRATEELTDTGIGHVAIGGITVDNVGEVLAAGAGAIAVCSAVTEASDPTAACRALRQRIAALTKA